MRPNSPQLVVASAITLLLLHRGCHWTFSLPSPLPPPLAPVETWSRLNALASLYTSCSAGRTHTPALSLSLFLSLSLSLSLRDSLLLLLFLLFFPSIVSPYTRAQIFTRDRKWMCDQRRALCESTARVSIVFVVNCLATRVFRGKLSGKLSRTDRPTMILTRPGFRELTD